MTSQLEIDLYFKLILVGDSGVGKTNILTRYTKNVFNHENKTTIGVEFASKVIKIQDHVIKLQIWDTAGQERFKSLTVAYYKGSKGAIIVFDVTKRESFDNVINWLNDIKKNGDKETIILLIGNKIDIEEREVSFEEAKSFSEKYNIGYVETSALSKNNIDHAFNMISENIFFVLQKNYKNSEEDRDNIKDGYMLSIVDKKKTETKGCC